jgi:nucleoside-diphosphate-sugar epimerase
MKEMKNVIITGATGMIGGNVLNLCLKNIKVNQVTSISRRALPISHPKLKQVIHGDFLNFKSIENEFKNQDVSFYCLGAYTGSVSTEKLGEITFDYTKSFADILRSQNDEISFNFLSGAGADLTEKSSTPFSKFKGQAENHLISLKFANLHIFRPGYIYPVSQKEKEPNLMYDILRRLYPFLVKTMPTSFIQKNSIKSDSLARAMVEIGLNNDCDIQTLENSDIEYYLKNKEI